MSEQDYVEGSRRAWLSILQLALRHLEIDDVEAGKARWVSERQEIIAKLREICKRYGDNDWPDDLHLADVIEKHLYDHLESASPRIKL